MSWDADKTFLNILRLPVTLKMGGSHQTLISTFPSQTDVLYFWWFEQTLSIPSTETHPQPPTFGGRI